MSSFQCRDSEPQWISWRRYLLIITLKIFSCLLLWTRMVLKIKQTNKKLFWLECRSITNLKTKSPGLVRWFVNNSSEGQSRCHSVYLFQWCHFDASEMKVSRRYILNLYDLNWSWWKQQLIFVLGYSIVPEMNDTTTESLCTSY